MGNLKRDILDGEGRNIADMRYQAEREENLAHARLLAASPALYDLVLTSMDGLCGAHTVMWQEKRRAVLAKVKMTNTADIHTVHSAGELTFTESEIEPNRFAIQANGNWLMSITHNGEQVEQRQRENLLRLVACWNAFEGVSTETIESEGKAASKRKPTLKQALDAHRMLSNWIKAVPQEVVLTAMPGIDGDWLDEVESNLRAETPSHGDIRALKHRIHKLEGEVIGYKQMLEEAETAAKPEQETNIPEHLDVRKILLAVTPGEGSGLEVYAKSVNDVVDTLTELDERLGELQFGIRPIAAEQGTIIIEMDCGAIQSTISKGVTASCVIIDRAAEFADEDSIVQIDGERVSVHRYSVNGGEDEEVNRVLAQLGNDTAGQSSTP
jgi:uncharacterized protein YeaC (DUF1315 family)